MCVCCNIWICRYLPSQWFRSQDFIMPWLMAFTVWFDPSYIPKTVWLREYAQMMRKTPIVSHLYGFTVALNNEKKKLVKFHFRNPLINIHQKSFTFLIFCVVAFTHSYSCQHESLSQTCCFPKCKCMCSYKSSCSYTQTEGAMWDILLHLEC